MEIKTLAQLQEPDSRTLRFTPLGLGLTVQMRPEASSQFQQEAVAGLELARTVAEGTRMKFEDLRTVFGYGVLCYEIFTLVRDQALLVIEQALRDRFLEWHHGTVVFVDPAGVDHAVNVSGYEEVMNFIKKMKNKSKGKGKQWKLRLGLGRVISFGGMLTDLYVWARGVGLLRGHRNRGKEKALTVLRNFVAHANGYHLGGPVESARTLSDVAEIINQLWGFATPGGRLYPAPLRREAIFKAWNKAGTEEVTGLAADIWSIEDSPEWTCVVLRAFFSPEEQLDDPGLHEYDSWYEVTRFPVDLLWGPGPVGEAAQWIAEHDPQADECDYLDRIFVVQEDNHRFFLPMQLSVAAAMSAERQTGTWRAIRCDHASDAWNHGRSLVAGQGCSGTEVCRACNVENLAVGSLTEILGIIDAGPASLPTPVSTPWAFPQSRLISEL